MAAAYKKGIQKIMDADIDLPAATIKARLLRTSAYTFSQLHDFLDDLPVAIITDVTLATITVTDGSLDALDAVFLAVPSGAAIDAVAFYKDTGVASTSPLFLYLDGFSVTPNGGDITLSWPNIAPFIWTINP